MRFRLATFNVENLGGRRHPGDAALRALLDRLAADVLCLQEVNPRPTRHPRDRRLDALDRLIADGPYRDHHRVVTLNEAGTGPRDVQNLVILSRFPVRRWAQVRHELVPPIAWPGCADAVTFDRPILHAVLDLGGADLHVVNLHLRAPMPAHVPGGKSRPFRWTSTAGFAQGCAIAEVKRAGQALEARLLVDKIFDADPTAAIVVAGDFNAGLSELAAQTIRAAVIDTGNADLAPRALEPVEARLPDARRHSVRHGGRGLLLDHLMVSQVLARACAGVDILNDDLTDELVDWVLSARRSGSHHAPVAASFDWSTAASGA